MLAREGSHLSYLSSPLHEFWFQCGDRLIHPDDDPFFGFDRNRHSGAQLAAEYRTDDYGPWPFDGPLDSAKVIVCYANPLYSATDRQHATVISQQRSGVADLPGQWDSYYRPRIGTALGYSMDELRRVVSVFNVCPYPSLQMSDRAIRFAAGLPSVWAAQRHLREVLIPLALEQSIFLVFARKHQLWGVIEGFESPNIAFSRNIGGHLGPVLGSKIREWLKDKSYIACTGHYKSV